MLHLQVSTSQECWRLFREEVLNRSVLCFVAAQTLSLASLWEIAVASDEVLLLYLSKNGSKSVTEKANEFYSNYLSDDEKDNTLLRRVEFIASLLLKFACKSSKICQSFISRLQKDRHGNAKQATADEST